MPDQNSAANEHALMREITAPLAGLPDDPVPVAANIDFPIVLRGYDRIAVDAYVKKTSQLVAELQATRSPEAAVRRAIERVGEEISGVLQRAHETAEQITTQSRREAENRLEAARREAAEIVADAHQRLRNLDSETDRIWAERDRIVEDIRQLSRQLTTLAGEAAARFGEEEEEQGSETVPVAEALGEPADDGEPAPLDPGGAAESAQREDETVRGDDNDEEPARAGGVDDGRRTIVIPEHPEDFPAGTAMPEPEEDLSRTNVMPKADRPPQR